MLYLTRLSCRSDGHSVRFPLPNLCSSNLFRARRWQNVNVQSIQWNLESQKRIKTIASSPARKILRPCEVFQFQGPGFFRVIPAPKNSSGLGNSISSAVTSSRIRVTLQFCFAAVCKMRNILLFAYLSTAETSSSVQARPTSL